MEAKSSLGSIILQLVLEAPEIAELIDRRAEEKFRRMNLDQRLTRDQMASLYQVHKDTIDSLTANELFKLGWEKIYIGSLPRFQRITLTEVSKENLKKAKKHGNK